jgi:O-antigen ligase
MSGAVLRARASPAAALLALAARLRGPALLAFLLLADALLALAIVHPRFEKLLFLGLGVVALALVFRFPFAAACGVLFLAATVFGWARFKFGAGPTELRLGEIVLGALVLVALVRPRRDWWGGFAGAALAVFLCLVAFAALLAVETGRTDFSNALNAARLFAPLTLFYVIVRLFPEPEQVRRLLLAAVVMAALTGIISLLVALPGSGLIEVFNPEENATIRSLEGLGLVNRVRLPGVMLAYGLFWYAAVMCATAEGGKRLLWLGALTAMGITVALSFNRTMWIGLAIGLLLMLLLSRAQTRRQILAGIAVLVAGVIGIALYGAQVGDESPLYPIIQRGETLADPVRTFNENSIEARRVESRVATAAIKDHPLIGVGPGAPFGLVGTTVSPDSRTVKREEVGFLHNQYLYLLLIGGPAALIAFLAFLATSVGTSLRVGPPRPVPLALGVGLVSIMVSAIVLIAFADPTGAVVLALLAGAIAILSPVGVRHPTPQPARVP